MKKSITAVVFAALLPILVTVLLDAAIPPQYEQSFLGGLKIKEEYADSIDERKILLIGGSNLPFGVDCEIIEEYTGMPTVNFGLYAALGTKFMLDQSRAYIEKGDIVIICPETSSQTMSLYFGAQTVWQAADAYPQALTHLRFADIAPLLGAYPTHLAQSFQLYRQKSPLPEGVYNVSSFDTNGDLLYPREKNILPLGYDPNMTISMTTDLIVSEFTDYVNDYTAYAEKKGAYVFYSFPPMNRSAVTSSTEEHADFFWALSEALDCEVISSPEAYIFDAALFYDSNFHLNDKGVPIRSMQLAEDILRAAGYSTFIEIPIPDLYTDDADDKPAPEIIPADSAREETDAAIFTTDEFGSGVIITGVTEAAEALEEIVVPTVIGGKSVLAIGENAFSPCTELAGIVIGKSVVQLYDGIFRGCSKLKSIILEADTASTVGVGENLTEGADQAMIYVPEKGYVSFVSDYFWSRYASVLRVSEQ